MIPKIDNDGFNELYCIVMDIKSGKERIVKIDILDYPKRRYCHVSNE